MNQLDDEELTLEQERALGVRQAVARASGGLVLGVVFLGVEFTFDHQLSLITFALGACFGLALVGMGLLEVFLPQPPLSSPREWLVWAELWAAAGIMTLLVFLQIEYTRTLYQLGATHAEALEAVVDRLQSFTSLRSYFMLILLATPLALQSCFARGERSLLLMPLVAPIVVVIGFSVTVLLEGRGGAGDTEWIAKAYVLFLVLSGALVAARALGDWVERSWTRWRTSD